MDTKKDLALLAKELMNLRGMLPEFSEDVLRQLSQINTPAKATQMHRDLRSLLWCSIDNDDSKDLDQLTYAEKKDENATLWVAIADVDALVKQGTPIDTHAQINTTSVYTPARIFPMLPEKLSTDLTSLNEDQDRIAIVIQIEVDNEGNIKNSLIVQALVHNYAKLTYNNVSGWLDGKSTLAKPLPALEKTLRIHNEIAQLLKKKRQLKGALPLESSQAEVKLINDQKVYFEFPHQTKAHQIIEEFMICANQIMADHFKRANIPNLRRVVETPKNWDRIVSIAKEYNENLPPQPDAKALEAFLSKRKTIDPLTFPDLSLTIIKLLGRGQYVVENDPKNPIGHFALAISDYTHSTAPNRRYPDLITQRQYKAFLNGTTPPYSLQELQMLAVHCSQQEDAATKIERQANKSAAALILSSQIGSSFKGIITGVNDNGIWVRIFDPAVEGKLLSTQSKLEVGDKVMVELKYTDIRRGFIDFIFLKKI